MPTAMIARPATPPTTPPTIAPVCDLLPPPLSPSLAPEVGRAVVSYDVVSKTVVMVWPLEVCTSVVWNTDVRVEVNEDEEASLLALLPPDVAEVPALVEPAPPVLSVVG